jgi:hypothetical protein
MVYNLCISNMVIRQTFNSQCINSTLVSIVLDINSMITQKYNSQSKHNPIKSTTNELPKIH